MIGIILIVVGIICLIGGFLFLTNKSENQTTKTTNIIGQREDSKNLNATDKQHTNSDLHIINMIDIAVADTYLSENKKQITL